MSYSFWRPQPWRPRAPAPLPPSYATVRPLERDVLSEQSFISCAQDKFSCVQEYSEKFLIV